MTWDADLPQSATSPATPAAPPPSFEQIQQAQDAYSQAEVIERDRLENTLDAIDDEIQQQLSGWFRDVLPWIAGGLSLGLAVGYFTRRKA